MIYLGSHTVNYLWLGSNPVDAAWLGSNPVYPYSVGNAYITPTSLSFPNTSSTGTLNVYDTHNHGWTIQGGTSVVSLSRYSGTGNATITVTASANPYSISRDASLEFKDSSTLATTTVNVTQAAAPAPSAVYYTITPGTFTVRYYNMFELDWMLGTGRDQSDITSGSYASPTYYGDVLNWPDPWSESDYKVLVPTNEYGTTKRVYYSVIALDIDGMPLTSEYTGSAYVDIPLHPAESIYTIQLPDL